MTKLHTFADVDLLVAQDGTKNYGSISSTEYRTSSIFNGIASGSQLKAYAVTDGSGFIQEVDSTTVNFILKPDNQPQTHYGAVKYFVYRGLKKSSFLSSDEPLDSGSATSDLLIRMWQVRTALNAAETNLDSSFTDLDLTRADLGLGPVGSPLAATTLLDEMFDLHTFQPITPGWYLGDFDTSIDYGFQVLLEGPNYRHTLGDVRTLDPKVTISYASGQPEHGSGQEEDISTKLAREQILSYIDPAAYFALASRTKMTVHKTGGDEDLSGEDVYNDLLVKFDTSDALYVDLRNELNNSLNFYGSYGDGSTLNDAQIKFLDSGGSWVNKPYETDGWPVLTLTASDFAANGSDEVIKASIQLPNGDNTLPSVYLAGASFYADDLKYRDKFQILTPGSTHSDTVELSVANNSTASAIYPFAIKVNYTRRYDIDSLPAIPGTLARPWKDDYMDNLLSPKEVHITPDSSDPTNSETVQWNTVGSLRYSGWTSLKGFDFSFRFGVAKDKCGETAFTFATQPLEIQGGTSRSEIHATLQLERGQHSGPSFFLMLRDHLGAVHLHERTLDTTPPTTTIQVDASANYRSVDQLAKSAENLLSLSYGANDKVMITNSTSTALSGLAPMLVLMDHELLSDSSDRIFYKAQIGIQFTTYNSQAYTHAIHRVATGVWVYSLNGRNYFSTEYSTLLLSEGLISPLIP